MKNRFVSHLVLGISVVALPFLAGCSQQNAGGSNPFVSSAGAEPVSVENDLAAVTETVTNAPAPVDKVAGLTNTTNTPVVPETNTLTQAEAVTAETAFSTEQKPPANVRLSPVLSEAVKLVQAGVNQSIVLNYITNTTGYFALGAEEIVYLNDLGVSGDVITTMMEHDKELRELRMNAWQAAQAAQAAASNQPPQQAVQPEPEVASAPTYVEEPQMEAEPVYVSDNYFYSTLSPYGSWVYLPGYGRCWRPTVAVCNPSWRPYCDRGRWVYSDCGWYWLSDYSWGSTAFHYGRWFNDNRWGWCWYPDTVWAPSWVSWRYTSDYCGWAPLPPGTCYQSGFGLTYNNGSVGVSFGFGFGASSYAFVPWGSFCSPRPYQYCVPASGAVHVYNNSKPYNQWEGGGRGQAYNRGLAPERVREMSRTEVRTVSVQDQNGRNLRAERLERDGRTLAVRRPQFTETSAGVANVSGTTSRPSGRPTVAPKTSEPVTSTSPQQQPVTPVTATAGRTAQREQWIANRTGGRSASPVVPAAESKVESKPPVAIPTSGENRPALEGDTAVVNRTPSTRPVVRATQQPVTTPAPTPKTLEPRVVQSTPQAPRPAQRSSIIVIGGGNNTRSGGRDYSVWSTPSQQPAPSASRENNNVSTRTTPPATVSTPQITDNSPAPAAGGQNNGWQSRGNNNRPENRGANQTYSTPQSTPQSGEVVTPSARPAPTANYNARPAQSVPAQNYAPRSQPSPAPSVSRVESRPAPAPAPAQSTARTTAPATAQSGQTQGRPNR